MLSLSVLLFLSLLYIHLIFLDEWIRREYRLRGHLDPVIEHVTWQMLPAPGALSDRVLFLMCPPREALAALTGRGYDIPDALAVRHWQPDTGLIRLHGVWERVRVVHSRAT